MAKTTEIFIDHAISIPRIVVLPKGEVRAGFHPFMLDLSGMRYAAPSDELWIQHLRTHERETIGLGEGGIEEARLEDYIVRSLMDFDDVAYDDHADMLYDLAGQTVQHLQSYLSEEDARKVLRFYQRDIARFIHAQMQQHFFEDAMDYEVKVNKGFTELKGSCITALKNEPPRDFRQAPADKSNMARYTFGSFERCLYSIQKFDSDTERVLAVILDRDALKWCRPVRGQFQLYYRFNGSEHEYQPDFVAETTDRIYLIEPKAQHQMADPEVLIKKEVAVLWCKRASAHAATYPDGKPWSYLLIPHTVVAENMTIAGLAGQFGG